MKRPNLILLLFFLTVFNFSYITIGNSATDGENYPPFYIKKVSPSEKFVGFKLIDTDGTTWQNSIYNSQPFIFITGKWEIRHDLRKWANLLNTEFGGKVNVLWVLNPSGTRFSNHIKKSLAVIQDYKPPIPVIIDSHSYIGRSLKIDYDIPTIIGITRNNLLGFVYQAPLNNQSELEIKNLIAAKILTF
jgi:hypothetical protein